MVETAGAAATATISLGGGRRICVVTQCPKAAQFTCRRDGCPETRYCLGDLEEQIILYRKNGIEIIFADEARDALLRLGMGELVHG